MEQSLSRRELKTLFYVGRKLELIACLVPMAAPQAREVAAQRSYGYDMKRADGRISGLRLESGKKIVGVSPAGNGFTEIKIVMPSGEISAHYRFVEVNQWLR